MHTIVQDQAIHVVGVELRTSNEEAAQTIPAFWQRLTACGALQDIPQRTGEGLFAVYTHFEHAGRNNQGLYSLIVGAQVPVNASVPAGMVRAVVPASLRAVFPVAHGQPEQVGAAWQQVWAARQLPKSYIADYEHYGADGSIAIFVGIHDRPGAP
ncbi:effector binding domain-containing protein [Pseudorhodoferax sp. LjRoot39]|uniref:GyrI-like domain-containing protein n=1 Tax=Pseudorhodoferax sp. LjRoot39 TaxID=3342328 RepID=UPI003ECF1625